MSNRDADLAAFDPQQDLLKAAGATRGHFAYESGHHGDLWLDLDSMFMDARRARRWACALTEQSAACRPEVVCGPLTGGAFIAQLLAAELAATFCFVERIMVEPASVAPTP